MKHSAALLFLCFLFLTVPVYAAPDIRIDGNIHVIGEYNDVGAMIVPPDREANCAVTFAYLHYAVDIPDYQLYLAFQFACTDYVPGGGKSGVEVTVNDILCTTFYADGTIGDVNPYFFAVGSAFLCFDGPPSEIHCEARIGIKYGFPGKTVVGIRILDCSGEPSNYYEAVVYTPPETTPPETTTEKPQKTTTLPETKPSTAGQTAAAPTTASSTTVRHTEPTSPRMTLATRCGTSAAVSSQSSSVAKTKKAAEENAVKKSGQRTSTNLISASAQISEVPCTAATAKITSAEVTTAAATDAVSVTDLQIRYKRFSKAKTAGVAITASMITAAIMISVFLTLSAKNSKGSAPDTENSKDDE